MELRQITTGKTDFMDLLLLGDEQEDMVMKYLERGEMAVLFDGEDAIALSVVTKEGENLWELKNIAVLPAFQGKGYGKQAVLSLLDRLHTEYQSGTVYLSVYENNPHAIKLYQQIGFRFNGKYDSKGEHIMEYHF